jgi:hypothetical protein
MKHLFVLFLCAVLLQLSSCQSASQDPTPAKPEIVVRYSSVGVDTSRAVVQVRTYSDTRGDLRNTSNATSGAGGVREWWIGPLSAEQGLTASILYTPCGSRRVILPPGLTVTLDILVNGKVLKTVQVKSGSSPYIAPIKTDVTLNGVELQSALK